MSNIQETIQKIKDSVAPVMEQWKKDRITFLKDLEQYCRHDVYKEAVNKRDVYEIHALKVKRGYNKSCEMYFGRSKEDFEKMIERDAETKMFNIERAAIKKLKNVEVKTVEKLAFHDNGGSWLINDEKVFSYEIIYAGGYNVQCFHIRVKFSYK